MGSSALLGRVVPGEQLLDAVTVPGVGVFAQAVQRRQRRFLAAFFLATFFAAFFLGLAPGAGPGP